MKRLTKDQELVRDAEVDWIIAQHHYHAQDKRIWNDYSPTADWKEAGPLIEKYKIDLRYYNKELNPKLEDEWMGGLQSIDPKTKILRYYTAFGPTPLLASMRALATSLNNLMD